MADTFPASLALRGPVSVQAAAPAPRMAPGNINNTVNLPSGGSVTYTASCSILAAQATGTLSNTATVATPNGVTDPTPATTAQPIPTH